MHRLDFIHCFLCMLGVLFKFNVNQFGIEALWYFGLEAP